MVHTNGTGSVIMSAEILIGILQVGHFDFSVQEGIPDDAVLIGLEYDPARYELKLMFSTNEWRGHAEVDCLLTQFTNTPSEN
jgi:hypothetical protein